MNYDNIIEATFISRPNRFIAHCLLSGKEVVCHVKNTGRCGELLIKGVTVYLEENFNPNRKTKYSLVAVVKGSSVINIDSQAPNKVVFEALKDGNLVIPELVGQEFDIKPEWTYRSSRFDFYLKSSTTRVLIEVKGVTLEQTGVSLFPDAPTLRGIKHLNELTHACSKGIICYVIFVIQLNYSHYFTPNYKTHRHFGQTLVSAANAGVNVLAYTCNVRPDSLSLKDKVEVKLEEQS